MRETRRKATALLAVLQLTAAVLAAQTPEVERLFPDRPVGLVNDFASVIDPASSAQMEDLLARLRKATGAEVAVVTLPTIGDRSPNEVGVAIIRRWGIGARAAIGDSTRNAGLVVLLVPRRAGEPNSGKIYVSVGQGLEGVVTDAEAGRVSDLMLPELARGEYGAGLLTGVRDLTGTIARAYGVTDSALARAAPRTAPVRAPRSQFMSLLPLLLFILFIAIANRGGRRRRVYWGGPWIGGGGWGGGGWGGGGFGGGGFGGFGGGGGASGGGGGRSF